MADQLEDLYREVVLDHFRRPRRSGRLEVPPAAQARGYNPLCGDDVTVYVETEGDRIRDIRIEGRGCAISQASASIMSELVVGKTVAEAERTTTRFRSMLGIDSDDGLGSFDSDRPAGSQLGDAEALGSLRQFPARIKCAILGWNTLHDALEEAAVDL